MGGRLALIRLRVNVKKGTSLMDQSSPRGFCAEIGDRGEVGPQMLRCATSYLLDYAYFVSGQRQPLCQRRLLLGPCLLLWMSRRKVHAK